MIDVRCVFTFIYKARRDCTFLVKEGQDLKGET
jgi:hypothetical protein